jgi:hypothetical protein
MVNSCHFSAADGSKGSIHYRTRWNAKMVRLRALGCGDPDALTFGDPGRDRLPMRFAQPRANGVLRGIAGKRVESLTAADYPPAGHEITQQTHPPATVFDKMPNPRGKRLTTHQPLAIFGASPTHW